MVDQQNSDLAYLVIREGSKWTDVFRLTPGRTVTIGRAATNQIVIKDERCSRNHAEVFLTGGRWTIRDLESRNGTLVGGKPIQGDYPLSPGDVVRIAHCQLAFVHDLSQAFVELAPPPLPRSGEDTVAGTMVSSLSDSQVLDPFEPTTITHRRGQTKFLKRPDREEPGIPKVGRAATQLCRLAFELASQADALSVAEKALEGLFEGTHVDAGAILLSSQAPNEAPIDASDLQVVASRTEGEGSYHRVSDFLGSMVLREGEAVLARNIEGDSTLGTRDSKGNYHASSVICAPVRQGSSVFGLVHLYCTQSGKMLDADDLEFTLAVAENVALALNTLNRQLELRENLSQSRSEVIQLRQRLGAESEIVGASPLMLQVQKEIARAAPAKATILIRGESGVGKELVARAIHYASPRKKGPFVCLNCAALSESLLESELFGHERGAFTGATERKIGKFEAAHQGTLMLDEIGEMSQSIQTKFLRVLEGHPFERVGGSQAIKVDVRVIAATNRDLEKAVAEGVFRRDLYFRLHVVEIYVPPLRKRPQDIIELANHFLDRFKEETGRKICGFTDEALRLMETYRWPGDVRELKNVVERNIATASESGELFVRRNVYEPMPLSEVERRHIIATLRSTSWNKSRAAEILGIERSTLDRKIRRYEIQRDA